MSYQDKEPRIVKLEQIIPAFGFPLEEWHGYGVHFSMNPGVCSTLLLRSEFLPDLRFISVAQPENRGDDVGAFWIEADKDHLGELGILELQEYVSGRIPLPMPPAVYGGSSWDGYYILNKEILDKVDKLRVHLYTPEGEYMARPSIFTIGRSARNLSCAEGITFDGFKEINHSRRREAIQVNLKDKTRLEAITLMFTSDIKQSTQPLPKRRAFRF